MPCVAFQKTNSVPPHKSIFSMMPLWLWFVIGLLSVASGQDSVVVSHSHFEKNIRGHNFTKWKEFVHASSHSRNPQAGYHLAAGITLSFAAIATITVGAISMYILKNHNVYGTQCAIAMVVGLLLLYAVAIFVYCIYYCRDPTQRIVSNVLLGFVPLNVSVASYLLALLAVRHCDKSSAPPAQQRFRKWSWRRLGYVEVTAEEQAEQAPHDAVLEELRVDPTALSTRLASVAAVLPGLATSIYLVSTSATGFTQVGVLIDVLAFCLFIDLLRLALSISYCFAPEWSFTAFTTATAANNGSDFTELPGAVKVVLAFCLVSYAILAAARYEMFPVLSVDPIKIHVLVCLTSYTFLPMALLLTIFVQRFLEKRMNWGSGATAAVLITSMWAIAAGMMTLSIVFNADEPNTLGVFCLLCGVFFAVYQTADNLGSCIVSLAVSSIVAFGSILLSTQLVKHFLQ